MRKKLRVAGYARVSTDEQKKYGYSIQAQPEEITQWCNDNDHALQHSRRRLFSKHHETPTTSIHAVKPEKS